MKEAVNFFGEIIKGVRSKGSFAQNLAITFSGNVFAQLVGFLFTPFVARIYGPASYGIFALFIGVVSNLNPISTLQLPSGFVAAEDDKEFYVVLKITFITLLSFTGLCTLILLLFGDHLISFFKATDLKPFLIWIPVYLLLMGLDNILLGWNIRLKEFKRGAVARVFSTVLTKSTAILFGVVSPSAIGLIGSNLLVYPIEGASKFSSTIRQSLVRMPAITFGEMKSVFLKFKGYALFLTPGIFVAITGSLLPVFYFSFAFDKATVGYYALSNSIVSIPLALVVNSSITVFLQKAAETLRKSHEELSDIAFSLYRKLFALSFFPVVIMSFLCKYIFVFAFGAAWEQAGIYAAFLCVTAVFHAIYSPLSVLFRLTNNEHKNLVINIIFLGVKFFGLWIGIVNNDTRLAIIGFCFASILASFVSLLTVFHILKISFQRLFRDFFLVMLLGAVVVWVYY